MLKTASSKMSAPWRAHRMQFPTACSELPAQKCPHHRELIECSSPRHAQNSASSKFKFIIWREISNSKFGGKDISNSKLGGRFQIQNKLCASRAKIRARNIKFKKFKLGWKFDYVKFQMFQKYSR